MKYCFTLILNLVWLTSLFAQEELRLISSRYSTIIDQQGFSSIQPVYAHKGSTLSADSGIIYEDEIGRQFFEAFGNVVITQPSGTIIYSDQLHYDATPQIATLTRNVRMVDDNSVLTTNHLIYKMRDKVGNYINGGRIISQGDTITSRTAYYFENTQDAYFRNEVIVRTPDVKIYTDTMRYNSDLRMSYFFGPTNIKGNSGENLYTERGDYNTEMGVANFNKNNLYTEGTRFLKGDSLYYERDVGVGKAYRNVVFVDTLDKFYAYGGYGLYDQADESITMTDKPLIIMVVESDSTDTAPVDSTEIAPIDTIDIVNAVDTEAVAQPLEIVEEEEVLSAPPIETGPEEIETTEMATEEVFVDTDSLHMSSPRDTVSVDSIYMTADTLYSRMIMLRDYDALEFNLDRSGGEIEMDDDVDYGDDDDGDFGDFGSDEDDVSPETPTQLTEDIVKAAGDSIATDSIPPGDLLDHVPIPIDSTMVDSLGKILGIDSTLVDSIAAAAIDTVTKKLEEELKIDLPAEIKKTLPADSAKKAVAVKEAARADIARSMAQDSVLRQQAVIPQETTADSLFNQAITSVQTPDTDTTFKDTTNEAYLDTAQTRIVKAYYNVRMFKSDLQAVADSVYYGMADSMFRFMGSPMIWAEGSQISSDTIYMQIQNQRMDNALLINNAFMVNAVLDTVKFNQLKGRKMTAFFANNSIDRLFVDGNAENITFNADEKHNFIKEMFHDRGARIKVQMEGKQIIDYITMRKVDQKVYPFKQVTQENEVLPGFIWRPQDRPTSKEDMMNRKREVEKPEASPEPSSGEDENTPEDFDDFEETEEIEGEEETQPAETEAPVQTEPLQKEPPETEAFPPIKEEPTESESEEEPAEEGEEEEEPEETDSTKDETVNPAKR